MTRWPILFGCMSSVYQSAGCRSWAQRDLGRPLAKFQQRYGMGGHSLRNVWYHDTARAGQSAKGKLAHRQKRMTVKASNYIASIEAAAPALAVQAINRDAVATRSTWLSWLDRLRLAAFLLCCPGELTRLLEGYAVSLGGRHQATMDLRGGSPADELRARSSPFWGTILARPSPSCAYDDVPISFCTLPRSSGVMIPDVP